MTDTSVRWFEVHYLWTGMGPNPCAHGRWYKLDELSNLNHAIMDADEASFALRLRTRVVEIDRAGNPIAIVHEAEPL